MRTAIAVAMLLIFVVGCAVVLARVSQRRRAQQQLQMNGPIPSWVIPESWSVDSRSADGQPVIARTNRALIAVAGHPSFVTQLLVVVPFNDRTENGLPESEDAQALGGIEDEIIRRLCSNNESIFSGVITGNNMRMFLLYTSDEAAAKLKIDALAREVTSHRVAAQFSRSPQWSMFREFAGTSPGADTRRPDVEVLAQLVAAGSDLRKPHAIEFFLYVPTRPSADRVSEALTRLGFASAVNKADAQWAVIATKSLVPEAAALASVRTQLEALAASEAGVFDGWGASVVP